MPCTKENLFEFVKKIMSKIKKDVKYCHTPMYRYMLFRQRNALEKQQEKHFYNRFLGTKEILFFAG